MQTSFVLLINSFKTFFEAYSFHINYLFFSKARNESLHDLNFHLSLKINGTVRRGLCIYEFREMSFLREVCFVLCQLEIAFLKLFDF